MAGSRTCPWNLPQSDPKYVVNGQLPYLDQGLKQEYLQTIVFDRP